MLAALLALVFTPAPALAEFKGDPKAATLARRMMDLMGDRQSWVNARWIYTAERAYFTNRPDPVDVAFWRATQEPAEWARVSTTGFTRASAWTAKGGWEHRNDDKRTYSREEMQNRLGWWPGEIYVMYHRLAKEDEQLRLVLSSERSFTVLDDATGAHLGVFEVGASGELVRWIRFFGTSRVEYVYGPLKSFGKIKMPDWGTIVDGTFRFYYTDVQLRSEAAPPVSLDAPKP
ncbi:MAG TPA: hypothetical protein VEA16_21640 [Vicinamibacterales bacterium]|nr:hypothetical protein [Vicinamibacterales bacterium]